MAVRIDNAADSLVRTTDLFDYNAPYTVMFWTFATASPSTGDFLELGPNINVDADLLRTPAGGVTFRLRTVVGGAAANFDGGTLAGTTWYHIAVVRESVTSLKLYVDGSLITTATTNVTGRTAGTAAFRLGGNSATTRRHAAVKAWSTSLTLAEVQNERFTILPKRMADLYGVWPCFPGATERLLDYNGNVRPWTEAGTLTDEEGPPVVWGLSVGYSPVISAAVVNNIRVPVVSEGILNPIFGGLVVR